MSPTSPLLSNTPLAPDPNLQQRKASDPDSIVWVSASAGSGKTTVLTNRVLRLLLPDPAGRFDGTPPHRLLCITYTKAAAAEMALRVQKNLSEWAIMEEGDLFNTLAELTGHDPDTRMLAAARKLFADVLECPGGLNLVTIHSFCQSVLGRFPLEAHITPDFSVLDDAQSKELFGLALEDVLLRPQTNLKSEQTTAFSLLSPYLNLEDLRTNIRSILRAPEKLEAAFSRQETLSSLTTRLKAGFGLPVDATRLTLAQQFAEQTPEKEVREAIAALNKTQPKHAINLQSWLDLSHEVRPHKIDQYQRGLLTKKETPYVLKKFATDDPVHAAVIAAEAERILGFIEKNRILIQTSTTAALMVLSRSVLQNYEDRKRRIGTMDYDDLIRKTDELLQRTSGAWVHYKLDGGIDHILMDEAQDTNPHQWNIIKNLSSEIFAGEGRPSERPRSLFIVGDEKQSIFSFQGADPVSFDKMRAYFEERSQAAERGLVRVPLDVSFRTTSPVLRVVDEVFALAEQRAHLGLRSEHPLRHYSRRPKDAGLVEIWPLQKKAAPLSRTQWEMPFLRPDSAASGGSVTEQIAMEIWGWLQKKEILLSQGRPIQAGDILILVRTRGPIVKDLIRQLKRRGLPVSGIDRLILSDQIGIQDLLALARFTRLPSDDFSLACILRSPLVNLSEQNLMDLALNREPLSLWEALQNKAPPALVTWLDEMIELAKTAAPFEFFEAALNRGCPSEPKGTGWRAMTARLGEDVIDPLEELMSLCLRLETQGIRTLESLILWQQRTPVEIKREMEEAGNQIRIMTVHASKGLEAPIVILPDTTSLPERKKGDKFLWPDQSGLPEPLWAPGKAFESAPYASARERDYALQMEEHSRLLYVALTRARDRLYIAGIEGPDKHADTTWYGLVAAAFARLEEAETLENGRLRLSSEQLKIPHDRRPVTRDKEETPTPLWLNTPPLAEPTPALTFSPSRGDGEVLPTQSPLDPEKPFRFRRGNITHKLLQILPDLPDSARETAARHYVLKNGRDLPADMQASIVSETLKVLRDSRFAPVFGPGSVAEIPITGKLSDGRIMNGQIDRLIIMKDTILVVDYKTNRPSPADVSQIPEIYLSQLRSYRDALAQIYPNYLINCALLWTDQPLLMPVPI